MQISTALFLFFLSLNLPGFISSNLMYSYTHILSIQVQDFYLATFYSIQIAKSFVLVIVSWHFEKMAACLATSASLPMTCPLAVVNP